MNRDDELKHFGVKGQKWGVWNEETRARRFGSKQYKNADGSLTAEGRKRYSSQLTLDKAYSKYRRKELGLKTVAGAAKAMPIVGVVAGASTGSETMASLGLAAGYLASVSTLQKANSKYKDILSNTSPTKTNEILIKSGDKFVRTSLKTKESDSDRMYVSYDKDKTSRKYYERTWPDQLRQIAGKPNAKVYQNTYVLKTDIVAPSLQRRREAAMAVINSDRKMKEEYGRAYAMNELRLRSGRLGAQTLSEIQGAYRSEKTKQQIQKSFDKYVKKVESAKNFSDDTFSDTDFKKFTAAIPTSPKLMNAYIKELKKSGFNAVFDDNSYSPAPFIVFDPKVLDMVDSKEIAKNR